MQEKIENLELDKLLDDILDDIIEFRDSSANEMSKSYSPICKALDLPEDDDDDALPFGPLEPFEKKIEASSLGYTSGHTSNSSSPVLMHDLENSFNNTNYSYALSSAETLWSHGYKDLLVYPFIEDWLLDGAIRLDMATTLLDLFKETKLDQAFFLATPALRQAIEVYKSCEPEDILALEDIYKNTSFTIRGQTLRTLLQQEIITIDKAILLDKWYKPEDGQLCDPLMDFAVLDQRINTLEDICALEYALKNPRIRAFYQQGKTNVNQTILLHGVSAAINSPEKAAAYPLIEKKILEGKIESINDLNIALVNPLIWSIYEESWISRTKAMELIKLCAKDSFFSEILKEGPTSWRRKLVLDPNFTAERTREDFNELYPQLENSLKSYPHMTQGTMTPPPILIIFFARYYDYLKTFCSHYFAHINSTILQPDIPTNPLRIRLIMARESLLWVEKKAKETQASLLAGSYQPIASYARFFPTPLEKIGLISKAVEVSERALQTLSVRTIHPSVSPLLLEWTRAHDKKKLKETDLKGLPVEKESALKPM